MVLSSVIVLTIYNKNDQKPPKSARVQAIFSRLGKLCHHKPETLNQIIPSTIDIKELQNNKIPAAATPDPNTNEQVPNMKGSIQYENTSQMLTRTCWCWKDAARILDKIFLIFYTCAVLILTLALVGVFLQQEYPKFYCN